MKIAKGPRPWTIWVFAGALLIAALSNLFEALMVHRALLTGRWFDRLPFVDWTPDLAIIATFSQFTIALIPLVWIFVFASKRARWVVLVFGLFKLPAPLQNAMVPIQLKAPGLVLMEVSLVALALIMLFLPTTTRWIRTKGESDAAVFE